MEDTIAAISTAMGEGGIGIIRISGNRALDILIEIFDGAKNKKIKNRYFNYGKIVKGKETIDEVLIVYMKAPNTYTCEDVVEINCHGSMISQKKILALVLEKGARLAEPGEFTKRAFINGRLDLSQAEAVIDLIKAKTEVGFDVAVNHLEGGFSGVIADIRNDLLDVLAQITVNIDYPDEDIEDVLYKTLESNLKLIKTKIDELINTAETGRIITEGINVAIVGKPNVGKSSLMNSIIGENRVIVTDIPGTTRDTIEEKVSISGIPIILTDTAGIRESDNEIEKHGIMRSKDKFNQADLVILVLDNSKDIEEEDLVILKHIKDKKVLVIINKTDLKNKINKEKIQELIPNATLINTSIKNNEGIRNIEIAIEKLFIKGNIKQNSSYTVNNIRHKDLLNKAASSISDGIEQIENFVPLEIVEIDINNSYRELGEIIGETVDDEIIDRVFSKFCLGK
ncbi:MAG TPA: tRNA uridine-5-carboxymethylaminomethyl(34) synthesis GTPase MnmE [Anaerovoracaceae bacterium]|nr:tRNA uridine-5-carboxymethylaminomethyl(34) synthesis GTPase MnmE [Anaerovoracaceae bacterium]